MNLQELRIGNYVNMSFIDGSLPEGNPTGLASINANQLIALFRVELLCSPIPLTEEWLLRFGFKKTEYARKITYTKDVSEFLLVYTCKEGNIPNYCEADSFILEGNGGFDESGEMDIMDRCQYVHQLQNLYNALIGEELI